MDVPYLVILVFFSLPVSLMRLHGFSIFFEGEALVRF